MLVPLGKLAAYIPLAIEAIRWVGSVCVEKYRARKAEEERKRAEAESIRKGQSDGVRSNEHRTEG